MLLNSWKMKTGFCFEAKEKKAHSVPPVQYMERIVRAGGCLVVVAQWSEHWQLKPGALGSIPGDCRLFTFFSFASKQTTCVHGIRKFSDNIMVFILTFSSAVLSVIARQGER